MTKKEKNGRPKWLKTAVGEFYAGFQGFLRVCHTVVGLVFGLDVIEDRKCFFAILNELTKNRDIILFIDEIHTIVGAGNAQGSMDAANMLKPALARGEIQCIGASCFSSSSIIDGT